ncbi:DUF5671 domain-containing protein [Stenotrophomonas mori]|uniref:DUF5671 domain-containing protein n=1 Tax=Stenotrophomonas mori TaxID=2871096 RepID=A0ABT0SGY2_9GAMM|nr:DUF5671 domain-containing protein [Stenotrophomonas mori]MCL7714244.1 DUF5671 domain-containing protein [Stenotrophomonas mori]
MASASPELERFVRDALMRGHPRDQVRQALLDAGWSAEQIQGVLDGWAEGAFALPVPRPRASLSAREAFLYLLLFSALYFSAWNLGSLLFALLERLLPDPADAQWQAMRLNASMRWSVSALLIAFPVFALLARHLAQDVARHPIKRLSPIRRWLTYLTLFAAAAILIGDLTVLVYNLLGGELSLRFLLKVGVVAAITGTVLGHYLRDLRREEVAGTAPRATGRRVLWATGIVTALSIAAGATVMDSPVRQRLLRLDNARVEQLQTLDSAVRLWWSAHQTLPADLAALAAQPGVNLPRHDPDGGSDYRYRPLDATRYALCADFATDSGEPRARWHTPVVGEWAHPAGAHCFQRSVGARD